MKQVLQSYRTGELTVAEVPAPGVEAGSVLVLTLASLVSAGTERSALSLAQKSLAGKARERPDLVRKVLERAARDGFFAAGRAALAKLDAPLPLGSSCAGRVLAVGAGVSGFAVGDRVACAGARAANHAEVNLIPQHLCALIPAAVPDADAAFVTLGAIALHGVRQAQPTLGETFAVIGLGLIGQLVAQLLRASGCVVLGVDLDPRRVSLSRALGAEAAVLRSAEPAEAGRAMTSGRGVDGVIIAAATASNDPIALAGELCRDRGRVVALGAVGLEVPRRPYYDKELSLVQSRSYGPGRYDPDYEERGVDYPAGYVRWTEGRNLEAFLAQCALGRVKVAPLVTHRFPIERADEAYALLENGARPAATGTTGTTDAGAQAAGEPLGILLTYPALEVPARTVQLARKPGLFGRRAHAAGDAIAVGVIGAGSFASGTLLPLLAANDRFDLAAIASARGVSARHAAERHRIPIATTDVQRVIAAPSIDAVLIATRHHLHAAQAEAALLAGKHVFVEKPLALNEAELAPVIAAQRASGNQLMVGYNRRFAPLFLELQAAFAGRRAPLIIDYRINAGPVPDDSWIHQPGEGGGRIIGEACHFIDLCCALTGSLPATVFAQGVAAQGGARADDNAILSLRFLDGSIAAIAYVATGDPSAGKERIEVSGDGATAVLEDFRRLEVRRAGKVHRSRTLAQDKGHRGGLAAFASAIASGAPAIPLAALFAVSRASFAAVLSLRTGEPIRLGCASGASVDPGGASAEPVSRGEGPADRASAEPVTSGAQTAGTDSGLDRPS